MEMDLIQPVTQFGVAGLMGVLWVWERLLSRKREAQLDEAHGRISRQGEDIRIVLDAMQRNTAALERFEQTQARLGQLLERMNDEMRRQKVE
jgi:hypothetical protein